MLFLDSSNKDEIKKYICLKIINGVTTNQKIFLKDKQTDYKQAIIDVFKAGHGLPISIELTNTSGSDRDLVKEAMDYHTLSEDCVIKIPMWSNGRALRIAKMLKPLKIPVNITCCMSAEQVLLAAQAEVEYVSLFYNRIIDYKKQSLALVEAVEKANEVVADSYALLHDFQYSTQLIAGSIRKPSDVTSCLLYGADIVTVTPEVLAEMFNHPKTTETILEFDNAWKELTKL